jgi:hypothetical protein
VACCLFTGILLFLCRLGARRQIALRLNTAAAARLFNTLFGAPKVPHGDTIRDLFAQLDVAEVEEALLRFVEILIDRKVLYPWRLLDTYYVVALDATGTVCFSQRHCPHCLTKTTNGKTVYYHHVLQASIVTPAGLVFPLMAQFIENPEPPDGVSAEQYKQDCETKAFYRLAPRLAKRFPRLPLALVMDGLYATGPVFEIARRYGWKFLIGLSDHQLTSVNEEFHALVAMHPENALTRTMGERGQIHQEFAWANDIVYQDTCKHNHTLDVLQCRETKPQKEETTTFRWVVNLHVEAHNAAHLANNAARLRWKTENEVFNVQKNNGFALEHAYANNENAAKIFHVLLQFAFILHELIQYGSLFRNAFPHGFGSAKNLAAEILEAVRRIAMSPQDLTRILAQRIQIRFPVRPPTHTLAAQIYVPP